MLVLSTILQIISIFCYILLAFILPLGVYDYLGGREKLDRMLEKMGFKIRWKHVDIIGVIIIFIAAILYLVCNYVI